MLLIKKYYHLLLNFIIKAKVQDSLRGEILTNLRR